MSKDVVPIHGEDHCPGGPDEIPCLANDAWIALYDRFIIGQQIGDSEPYDVPLKFPAAVISDNGDDYFGISTVVANQHYRAIIKEDGVYNFTFWLAWNEPSVKSSKYIVHIATTAGSYTFPGEPLGLQNLRWEFLNTISDDASWSDWNVHNHASSTIPLKLDLNVPPTPATLDPRLVVMEFDSASFDIVIGAKALIITRHGPLSSTRTWPSTGIGS
jgi:hypothetical protein